MTAPNNKIQSGLGRKWWRMEEIYELKSSRVIWGQSVGVASALDGVGKHFC